MVVYGIWGLVGGVVSGGGNFRVTILAETRDKIVAMTTLAQLKQIRQQRAKNLIESIVEKRQQQPPKTFLSTVFSWDALGVLIPIAMAVTGWYFLRKKKTKLKAYFEKIDETYGQFKTEGQQCEAELYNIKHMIEQDLKEGKVEEGTYQLLVTRIERYLKEVRKQMK